MLKQTIKRMFLTGATVMVMMSFAVPAMAMGYAEGYADSGISANGGTETAE